jgi:hydroxyacyl-ACP dehydratase HTD2-like protein with hotdog domain
MSLYARCLGRVARTPPQHTQWRRSVARCYASTSGHEAAWFTELRSEMLGRPLPSAREHLDKAIDKKLLDTLSTFLPPEWCQLARRAANPTIPMGHHLVWFNTSMPADKLLADGTDPLQSPGAPWTRRMWAGGQLELRGDTYFDNEKGFAANSDMVCAERIKDVRLMGQGNAEKIFVTIERRYARNDALHARRVAQRGEHGKRGTEPNPQALFRDQLSSEEWGDALLREERNLVFLKEKTSAELEAIKAGQLQPVKYLDCQ